MKKVRSNGMGAHTAEEIESFGKKDLQTLSEMLGDKEFFFGDDPAMLDLVVFSHVAQLVMVDKEYAGLFCSVLMSRSLSLYSSWLAGSVMGRLGDLQPQLLWRQCGQWHCSA